MLSNIRPAPIVAAAIVFACGLGLVARYIAAPLPIESPAVLSAASIPAAPSAELIGSGAPLPSELLFLTDPAFRSDTPGSRSGDRASRGILLTRQCLAIAERDPLAAMEMAAANQLHEMDPGLAASLMAQWARRDFDRACEWTRTQEPSAWRDDVLARLAYVRAQADPVAAARLVAEDISAGPARDEAVICVIHQWALRDARGAALWAQSMTDEALRQRASDEIAALATTSSAAKSLR